MHRPNFSNMMIEVKSAAYASTNVGAANVIVHVCVCTHTCECVANVIVHVCVCTHTCERVVGVHTCILVQVSLSVSEITSIHCMQKI